MQASHASKGALHGPPFMKRQNPHSGAAVVARTSHAGPPPSPKTSTSTRPATAPAAAGGSSPVQRPPPPCMSLAATGSASASRSNSRMPTASSCLQRDSACSHAGVTKMTASSSSSSSHVSHCRSLPSSRKNISDAISPCLHSISCGSKYTERRRVQILSRSAASSSSRNIGTRASVCMWISCWTFFCSVSGISLRMTLSLCASWSKLRSKCARTIFAVTLDTRCRARYASTWPIRVR
mmetsp:Transcript_17604/g.51843  ORF Transcript_17604/g.51843 Transcript_17604/m.51843 type:complete len:238 (+) Transcript_17604:129-842(+)